MSDRVNIKEISAEMLLDYLYPELSDKWTARYAGAFYRNYSEDIVKLDADACHVTLTRDGALKLLPQGLLTTDDELKEGDFSEKEKALKKRKSLLEEIFLPFDSFTFRNSLHIERQISQLLDEKLDLLLKKYFHYDLAAETDKYVKELAVMLPFTSRLRADFGFIGDVLSGLTGYGVEMFAGRYSESDDTVCWLPMVKYEILAEDLEAEEYNELNRSIDPLRNFIREWFIPFDTHLEIVVKHHGIPFILQEKLTLDYNTEINK
ncbi:MAG: hypothetical protein LBR26_04330 [Prevotella sp.]|jgi:hypothetical protein|nr:hypothetical protein [Prevotella sp.]